MPKSKQKTSNRGKDSNNEGVKNDVPKAGKDKPPKTRKNGASTGKKKGD